MVVEDMMGTQMLAEGMPLSLEVAESRTLCWLKEEEEQRP